MCLIPRSGGSAMNTSDFSRNLVWSTVCSTDGQRYSILHVLSDVIVHQAEEKVISSAGWLIAVVA